VDATGAPAGTVIRLRLVFMNQDGTRQSVGATVPPGTDLSTLVDTGVITAAKKYSSVRVELKVKAADPTAAVYFDDISVTGP